MEHRNQNEKETFSYTYSSNQKEEVLKIRNKYVPKEEDKMEQLIRLDKSVGEKATVYSLIVGIIGTLIMGIGMCCCLVWGETLFIPGVVIGVIGIAVLSVAYPLYQYIIKKERERIAPEIIRLTDELMK